IGGGWAGCAASIAAIKLGVSVVLIEKTDMLLGLGNVGGIMRNNGRYTAAEENILLGRGELFDITDKFTLHKNVEFPGHKHAYLYDVTKIEPAVRKLILSLGVELKLQKRAIDVILEDDYIKGIVLDDGEIIYGDGF